MRNNANIKRILSSIGLGIILLADVFTFYLSYLTYGIWQAPRMSSGGLDVNYGFAQVLAPKLFFLFSIISTALLVWFIFLSILFYKSLTKYSLTE